MTSTLDAGSPTEPEDLANDLAGWSVYRQDDDGNRFLVESHLVRVDADGWLRNSNRTGTSNCIGWSGTCPPETYGGGRRKLPSSRLRTSIGRWQA